MAYVRVIDSYVNSAHLPQKKTRHFIWDVDEVTVNFIVGVWGCGGREMVV